MFVCVFVCVFVYTWRKPPLASTPMNAVCVLVCVSVFCEAVVGVVAGRVPFVKVDCVSRPEGTSFLQAPLLWISAISSVSVMLRFSCSTSPENDEGLMLDI